MPRSTHCPAFCLIVGYVSIRARRIDWHRRCMIAAFVTSSLFLVCYVIYHAQVGSVRFTRQGFVRPLYFSILITHVALAAAVVPLAVMTLCAWPAGAVSAAPRDCALDASRLVVRVGDGRARLRPLVSTDLAFVGPGWPLHRPFALYCGRGRVPASPSQGDVNMQLRNDLRRLAIAVRFHCRCRRPRSRAGRPRRRHRQGRQGRHDQGRNGHRRKPGHRQQLQRDDRRQGPLHR